MATGNSENHVRNILVLSEKSIPKNKYGRFIKEFANLNELDKYLCAHIKDADNFYLHVSDGYLEELIKKYIHKIQQVRRIDVYYSTDDTLQSGQIRFPSGSEDSEKLDFHLERDLEKELENAETGGAVDPSRPVDQIAIDNITTLTIERLHAKRRNSSDCRSPDSKRFAPTVEGGFFMQNINPYFICPSCKIFFEKPYQLECEHRICKLCLNSQSRCSICLKVIAKDKAWFDKGFENDKQDLLTTCLECKWSGKLKFYQDHLNQNHPPFSNYSILNEQIAQIRVLSAQRLSHLASNSAMSILLNIINVLNDDIQRMNTQIDNYQHSISVLAQQLSSLKILVKELNDYRFRIGINQNLLIQQLLSLKEHVEDFKVTSFDGTLTWKITCFQEKRMNAVSEGPISIYSPPFYSSRTGYKMRLRLFLNGDRSARGTDMSLFLIIMRGDYDAIVHWPFNFKVTFTLLNQSESNNSHSNFFWSDTTSPCFQRPTTDMNSPYGFPTFFSLIKLQENENHFVQDNTAFFRVEIDFYAKKSEFPINNGASELMNDEAYHDITGVDISATICPPDNSNDIQ